MAKKGIPEGALDDVAEIAAEHARERAGVRAPRRGPWVIVATLLFVSVITSGVVGGYLLTRPFDPREAPLGAAIAARLPEVVRLAAAPGADADAIAKAWWPAGERKQVPPEVAAALDASVKTLVSATGKHDDAKARLDAFYASVGQLDATLTKANAPYYVDGDFLEHRAGVQPYPLSFYVEREVVVEAEGRTERALYLRRLDDLNVRQSALGYTHPRAGVAMVLLDETESLLVTYVLPALAPNAPLELCDPESVDEKAPWQDALRKRAGEVVRAEFARVADDDLREVGRLLARRAELVKSWDKTMAQLGLRLLLPTRLVPEGDYSTELRRRIGVRELSEWDDLHASLVSKRLYGAFTRARDLAASGTERHEVQHRLDYARGFVGLPDELQSMLGVENPLDVAPSAYAGRVRAEYSAYLAQLAEGASSPQIGVLDLSHFMFDARDRGGVYGNTALAVIRSLAKHLDIPGHDRLVYAGRPMRKTLSEVVIAIWSRPEAELRKAAREIWERAYGVALPKVVEKSRIDRPTWRH